MSEIRQVNHINQVHVYEFDVGNFVKFLESQDKIMFLVRDDDGRVQTATTWDVIQLFNEYKKQYPPEADHEPG